MGHAEHDADDAADDGERHRLYHELPADVALLGSYRLAQADFARALGHGREHHVHDADAADQKRDCPRWRRADT